MKNTNDLQSEYDKFLNIQREAPPQEVTTQILDYVRTDLKTTNQLVFAKVLILHIISSVLTLSICPQFGVSVFGNGIGLIKYFSSFGIYGCLAVCGILYITVTVFLSRLVLHPVEWARVDRYSLFYGFLLGLISLLAFMVLGADIILKYGAIWLLSTTAAGLMAVQILNWRKLTLKFN